MRKRNTITLADAPATARTGGTSTVSASAAISETVADNHPNTKRGRPQRFTKASMDCFRGLFPETKSQRGIMDMAYRIEAIRVLTKDDKDDRFHWLVDKAACIRGEDAWKPTILTELGRIEDEQVMKEIALRICELKPRNKEAVAIIRRYRSKDQGEGNCPAITNCIIGAVNAYLQRHPATTFLQLKTALINVAGAYDGDLNEVFQ